MTAVLDVVNLKKEIMNKANVYEITITPMCVKNRGIGGARAEALRQLDLKLSESQEVYPDSNIVIGYRIEEIPK